MSTLDERLAESRARNIERQKARCAPFGITDPNLCGQGYTSAHIRTGLDAPLCNAGFVYSHSTVITDVNGQDYVSHAYRFPRTDWTISVSVLANGGVSVSSSRLASGQETYFSPHDRARFDAYLPRKARKLRAEVRAKYANHKLDATFIYSGMIDYWGGDRERWEDDKGYLFANYNHTTTLRDIVDELVEDFNGGGDCDAMPEWITALDVKEAILATFSDQGLKDYHSGALSDWAQDCEPCEDEDCDCEMPVVIFLLLTLTNEVIL